MMSTVNQSKPLLRTYDAEKELEIRKDYYGLIYLLVGFITLYAFAFEPNRLQFFLELIPACCLMYAAADRTQQAEQLRVRQAKGRISEERMVTAIQEAFKAEYESGKLQIYHRVQAGEFNDLDIFLRFTETKTMFAISVKSWGEGKVVYHEKRETLCFRKKNGSLAYMTAPDPLKEIRDHEWWLRRNNRAIFGGSSRDTKRPVRKVIAFAAPTAIQEHLEHLYITVGQQKFVRIEQGNSSIFIVSEEQLLDFIFQSLSAQ